MGRYLDLLMHFWTRLFKGAVVQVAEHSEGGHLYLYESGYIEYKDKNGKRHDVKYDLYLRDVQPADWSCLAFGGGAAIVLKGMTREEAMRTCANDHGIVGFVDDERKLIFYRPKDWNPNVGYIK